MRTLAWEQGCSVNINILLSCTLSLVLVLAAVHMKEQLREQVSGASAVGSSCQQWGVEEEQDVTGRGNFRGKRWIMWNIGKAPKEVMEL